MRGIFLFVLAIRDKTPLIYVLTQLVPFVVSPSAVANAGEVVGCFVDGGDGEALRDAGLLDERDDAVDGFEGVV